jgi:hypothetical protein
MIKREYECDECEYTAVIKQLGRFPEYDVFCPNCDQQVSNNLPEGDSE